LIQRRNRTAISLAQLGAVLGIAIATYFLVDLTRMAWKNYLLSRIVHDQQVQIDRLKAENQRLTQVKQTIEQDSFVELWARRRGWVGEGEVRIVTVPAMPAEDGVARLLMPPDVNVSPGASSNWRTWWALFLDSP
jgi:cell division protein FtsB